MCLASLITRFRSAKLTHCAILIVMEDSITWEAPEFEHLEKRADWYWILGIVAAFGIILAILLKNYLFAILVLIGAGTMTLHAKKLPEIVEFAVSKHGVQANKVLYPYGSLESFWISEFNDEEPKLLLTSKKILALQIIIPLADTPPEEVRNMLLHHVEEVEQGESVVEHLSRFVRF